MLINKSKRNAQSNLEIGAMRLWLACAEGNVLLDKTRKRNDNGKLGK